MTIKSAILILVISVTIFTGILVFSLSLNDKVEIYETEFDRFTEAKMDYLKFAIEISIQENNLEPYYQIINNTKNEINILFSAITVKEGDQEFILSSNPENTEYTFEELNSKAQIFDVEKDTVFRAKNFKAKDLSGQIIVGFSTGTLMDSIRKSSERTMFQLIILSLIAIISGIIFAQRLTKPLEKLKNAAIKISSGQTMIRADENEGSKDIKILSYTFNKMLDRLTEMQKQRLDELSTWNRTLEDKNEQILSSIRYASTIQNAILPNENILDLIDLENFIIYKPKDIVSGDFFWAEFIEGKIVIILADCTGHGVPGAMISMMGNMILNDLILRERIFSASKILKKLDDNLIRALGQDEEDSFSSDGMDIGIAIIDTKEMILEYSGASRPIYVVKDNELIEIKGDRLHIGGMMRGNKKKEFTSTNIKVEADQYFYLSSDGFGDQIGENRKKFGSKRLKRIIENLDFPLQKQKELLLNELNNHQGSEEQRDDITIIGFKIK